LGGFGTNVNLNNHIKQTNCIVPTGTQALVGAFLCPPVETGGYDVLCA